MFTVINHTFLKEQEKRILKAEIAKSATGISRLPIRH